MVSTRWSNRPYCKKINRLFPVHLTSLRSDIGCPARSPDLSLCDYILWGYEMYKHRPTIIDGLKAATRQTLNEIS